MWPTFLSPWLPVAAGAIALPPLLLLYFLKLKRRRMDVSTTLLWKKAIQDLQVNSPFQKLRNNLLLILQLLVLLLALAAMSRPLIEVRKPLEDRVAILIDHSASMATVEADGKTRLQIAKEQAKRLVDDMPEGHRAMIIPFAAVARTLGPLTDDKTALKRQIDTIQQTAETSQLREAIALANASATPIGEGIGTPENPVAPMQIHLLSDGRIEDLLDLPPAEAAITMTRVGDATNNVGIVGLDVRREYERPEVAAVLVRVRNYGPSPVDTDLSVYVDGRLESAQPLHLEAGYEPPADEPANENAAGDTGIAIQPSEPKPPDGSIEVLAFRLTQEAAATLEIRLGTEDAFPADNRVWAILQPARRVSALFVSDQNSFRTFIDRVIPGLPLAEHRWMSTSEYESAPESELTEGGRSKYDVVVIDQHDTERVPPGNYLFFGSRPLLPPAGPDGKAAPIGGGEVGRNVLVVDWKDAHPVLRYVSVERISPIFEARRFDMPDDAVTLIEGEKSPLMSVLSRDGRQYLIVAFDLVRDESGGAYSLNTPWLHRVSFPIFLYNAIRFLSATSTVGAKESVVPGDAVSIPVADRHGRVEVTDPESLTTRLDPDGKFDVRFGETFKTGVYKVSGGAPGNDRFAVNLLNEKESNIRPVDRLIVGGETAVVSTATQKSNQPLWPIILCVAFGMLLLEWYVYNRRARI